VLRRFGEDASYWQGALKLNEALRHIAISFSVGETVLEAQAIPLAWIVALLAVLCLFALLQAAHQTRALPTPHSPSPTPHSPPPTPHSPPPTPHSPLLFILLYLLIPIAAILLLSVSTPKFNPRYLMLASPALILLLAGGLALPWRAPSPTPHSPLPTPHSPLPRALSLLALVALLAIFAFSLRNWFSDPAFTKDDWRGAVAYVKSQRQPDEAVVLVSGHAEPAWRYYAPDLPPVRLPEIETLDVNAVLDLSVAATLNSALAGQRGAWLVQWQDNVVDPNGVAPFLLDTVGAPQPVAASFWGLGTPQHYRFFDAVRAGPGESGTAFPTELPLTAAYQGQQLNLNFADQVELLGFSQPPCPQPLCPLYLFWRAAAPLAADLQLSATLFDRAQDTPASQPLDRRLAAYDYPTLRWRPGEVVLSRLDLPALRGTPPGDYRLRLGVYDAASGQALDLLDEAGAAQGQWAWLAPIVAQDLVTAGPGGPPADIVPVSLAPEILLSGWSVQPSAVEPGDPILVEAWWQALSPPPQDYRLGYLWIDPTGKTLGGGWGPPAGGSFPTSQWPAGALVLGRLPFTVPSEATPGLWTLRIGLQDATTEDAAAGFVGAAVDLPIAVQPSTRRFKPSGPLDFPSSANFDGLIYLLGVRSPATTAAGASLPVTAVWQAQQPMDRSFTGFVHLLDQGGQIVAQVDQRPAQGERPTDTWVAGEVVEDLYQLELPAGLPAGEYWLAVGLYDANRPGLPRLGDPALLGPITVAAD
jgi:hypothetical protein